MRGFVRIGWACDTVCLIEYTIGLAKLYLTMGSARSGDSGLLTSASVSAVISTNFGPLSSWVILSNTFTPYFEANDKFARTGFSVLACISHAGGASGSR